MATIYRFIIEQKTTARNTGRTTKPESAYTKSAAKKGRWVSIFGGDKGGVEHNRKMRAINPLINRATGGAWEKGMRVGRAALGLVTRNTKTGAYGVSWTAVAILISFAIQMLMKWLQSEQQKAAHQNSQNFKQLENGIGAINTNYKIATHILTGRHTYNQNK